MDTITKSLPIFAKENSKKVRYVLNDCFLIFWFRFFYKYQAFIENKALKALGDVRTKGIYIRNGQKIVVK